MTAAGTLKPVLVASLLALAGRADEPSSAQAQDASRFNPVGGPARVAATLEPRAEGLGTDPSPRSPFAGRSRAWLLREQRYVEAERPGLWLMGSSLLTGFGLLSLLTGFVNYRLESCSGFFSANPTVCQSRPPGEGSTALWAAGAGVTLGGLVLTTVLAVLEWKAARTLDALGLALEGQSHQRLPREPNLHPQLELK